MDILESLLSDHIDMNDEGELIEENQAEGDWIDVENLAEAVEMEACLRLVADRSEIRRLAAYHRYYSTHYQDINLELLAQKLEAAGFKCRLTDFNCYHITVPDPLKTLPITYFPFTLLTEKSLFGYGKRIELAIAFLAAATGQDRQALIRELVPPPPDDQMPLFPLESNDPLEQATRELIATAKMFLLQNRVGASAEEISWFFKSIHTVEDLLEKGKKI